MNGLAVIRPCGLSQGARKGRRRTLPLSPVEVALGTVNPDRLAAGLLELKLTLPDGRGGLEELGFGGEKG